MDEMEFIEAVSTCGDLSIEYKERGGDEKSMSVDRGNNKEKQEWYKIIIHA